MSVAALMMQLSPAGQAHVLLPCWQMKMQDFSGGTESLQTARVPAGVPPQVAPVVAQEVVQ